MNRMLILPALLVALLVVNIAYPGAERTSAKSFIIKPPETIESLTPHAEQGDVEAQHELGKIYEQRSREGDFKSAFKWYTLAAEQGYVPAETDLGILHHRLGEYKAALKWFKRAADKGSVVAQTELALMYREGWGVLRNSKIAIELLVDPAKRGWPKAQFFLGAMYEYGDGVEQDYKMALRLYRKAAKRRYDAALTKLGVMYEKGQGVPKNYTTALKWYRLAAEFGGLNKVNYLETRILAEEGDADAQYKLGLIYAQGETLVPRDNKAAAKWYRLAANQGHAKARAHLESSEGRITARKSLAQTPDFEKGLTAARSGDFATALRELKPLAEKGNPWAQYNLGQMYRKGDGVPQDFKTAAMWYTLSAEQGHPAAQYNLGFLYARGEGVPKSFKTAAMFFRLAAQGKGYGDAQTRLEDIEKRILAIERIDKGLAALDKGDYVTALRELTPFAEEGNAVAQEVLGLTYHAGKGVPQNYKTAATWYKLAAEQGRAVAQYNLAYMYALGHGVPRDSKVMWKWLKLAAAQGEPRAKKLVDLTEKPELFHKKGQVAYKSGDYATALREWTPLALSGQPYSQFLLGMMHETGRGVPKDYKAALKWYRLSADQGFARAQFALGAMYYDGNGVQQDYKIAVKWYRLAAEQGYALAQYGMGMMYLLGHGVSENQETAFEWAKLAAKQGQAGAQSLVKTIRKLRDIALEKRLIDIEMRQQERLIGLQEEIRQLRREVRRNANSSPRRPFFTPVPADRFIIPMPEFCTWETVNGRQYCLK